MVVVDVEPVCMCVLSNNNRIRHGIRLKRVRTEKLILLSSFGGWGQLVAVVRQRQAKAVSNLIRMLYAKLLTCDYAEQLAECV